MASEHSTAEPSLRSPGEQPSRGGPGRSNGTAGKAAPGSAPGSAPGLASGCKTGTGSCLVNKLMHYIALDETETSIVSAMQSDVRRFERDELLFREGDNNLDLYIVQEGWLFNYIDTPDGRRQIINVYHPGDVIGFPDMALEARSTNLFAVEAGSLCLFPKQDMGRIYREAPRLAALLLTIALREETVLIDRLRVFSRSSARARVAYLFLELHSRLAITTGATGRSLYMPLNQQEIGDAVGLTNVSVSRAISQLESVNALATSSRNVELLDRDMLVELCDFHDRYGEMATDWFPNHP